jgi:glycosyltransferase involved in cell wall biosynthesis
MRILYVCLDRGIVLGGTKGAAVHVGELVRAFGAEGHKVAVLGVSGRDGPVEGARFIATVPRGARRGPFRSLRRDLRQVRARRGVTRDVVAAINDFVPDLVYERYALFRTETAAVCRAAGIPYVLEVNAPLAWEEAAFRDLAMARTARRSEIRVWRSADLVVVPSTPMSRRIHAAGQARVLVAPNAVDPDRFAPRDRRAAVRRSLALDGRFVVAFAGSLKPWHDLPTIVRAVAYLPADLDATLLVIGDGPERSRLEDDAHAHGVALVCTGSVPHEAVGEHLEAADVCVAPLPASPALDYFSPLKALEYLAAGRPVVVADQGDLDVLAREGVALAYHPGDARDLADQLLTIAREPDRAAQLTEVGMAYARERTWRSVARTVTSAIHSMPASASRAEIA